eukprot:4582468-Prymnesium_polylepis.1
MEKSSCINHAHSAGTGAPPLWGGGQSLKLSGPQHPAAASRMASSRAADTKWARAASSDIERADVREREATRGR